jgi:hypothetical protein
VGPTFMQNEGPNGAKLGDHTHRSIVVRVEGRVIIGRSHAPSVFVVGAPANRFAAAFR